MAELKRLFIGAKMDKDSDERFVANGDFVDAKNIEIIHAENKDAGVVRNKKGNSQLAYRTFNPTTQTFTNWVEGAGDTAPAPPGSTPPGR